MKTRMNQNSLQANLFTNKKRGKEIVFDYIFRHAYPTQADIAKGTGLSRQTVAGRVNDLLYKDQTIKRAGKCTVNGRTFDMYRCRKPNEIAEMQRKSSFDQLLDELRQCNYMDDVYKLIEKYDR